MEYFTAFSLRTTFLETIDSLVMFRQGDVTNEVHPLRRSWEMVEPPVFPTWMKPTVPDEDFCGTMVGRRNFDTTLSGGAGFNVD